MMSAASLGREELGVFLFWMAILIIGSGALVLVSRVALEGAYRRRPSGDGDRTLMRSWLSIALVSGLLLFATGSFFVDDTTLRSLLMGGVIASAGTRNGILFCFKNLGTDAKEPS